MAATDGLVTSVSSSTTAAQFLGERSRKGMSVFNDSTAILYLVLGGGTASSTNYTVQIAAGGYYEAPYQYTGKVNGVWASANGNARMTEFV